MFLSKILSILRPSLSCKMSDFYQKLNPVTGIVEWYMQDDKYDYNQEVARSSYADMLHDTERNRKYYEALKEVISSKKQRQEPVHVLDIGAGTGLLSMMAASCGADSVTACETFSPMARCAKRVIADNNFSKKIKLINKRSDELSVGPDSDLSRKATVLVTEVFDTELIGEGAIPTFRHAHKHLLDADCVVIPSESVIYAQIIESELVHKWHQLQPISIPGYGTVKTSENISNCKGTCAAHDLQLSQLSPNLFRALSDPIPVLKFDFSGKTQLMENSSSFSEIEMVQSGIIHAIFMWWELKMDPEGKIMLSCAPTWIHADGNSAQWRDHWIQAIYYLPNPLVVSKGDIIHLRSYHDAYNIWFQVESSKSKLEMISSPFCECGVHTALSRTRIGMMNDKWRLDTYIKYLQKTINPNSICLCVDDGSLLPLIAAALGAKRVFTTQPRIFCKKFIESYISANGFQNIIKVLEVMPAKLTAKDLENLKIDMIISEPFFLSSLLPWENLHLWYLCSSLKKHRAPTCKIMPQTAILKLIVVEFEDLWKIRAPVGSAEGFVMNSFDEFIEKASSLSDSVVEPQPLWEYPCRALSEPVNAICIDLSKDITDDILGKGKIHLSGNGKCNGIALWMDWNLDTELSVTTGPTEKIQIDKKIEWDKYSRQGVYFFGDSSKHVTKNDESYVDFNICFNWKTGSFEFKFYLN